MDTKPYQFSIFYSPSTKRKVLIERSQRKVGDDRSWLDNKYAEYRFQFLSKMLIFKLPRTGGMAMELKKNDPNLKKDNDIGQIISSNVYVILFVLNIEKNNWQILTDNFSNGFTPENVLQGYVIDRDEVAEQQISDLVKDYNYAKSKVATKQMKILEEKMIETLTPVIEVSGESKGHNESNVEVQQSDSEEIEFIDSPEDLKQIPGISTLFNQFNNAEQKAEKEVPELKYLKSINEHLKIYMTF